MATRKLANKAACRILGPLLLATAFARAQLPPPPNREVDCSNAYAMAYSSVLTGSCMKSVGPCHEECQKLISAAMLKCKDVRFNQTDPETNKTESFPFDAMMLPNLQRLGPPTCDYHLGYKSCESTCSISDAKTQLAGCIMPNRQGSPVFTSCDQPCLGKYLGFKDQCAGCGDIFIKKFLADGASSIVECQTSCTNVTGRLTQLCCPRDDPAEDNSTECDDQNIPVVPDADSACCAAVKKSALSVCPSAFYDIKSPTLPRWGEVYEQCLCAGVESGCQAVAQLKEAAEAARPDPTPRPSPSPNTPWAWNKDKKTISIPAEALIATGLVCAVMLVAVVALALSKKRQRGELGDSLFIDTADGSGARTTAVYDIQAEGSATTFVA